MLRLIFWRLAQLPLILVVIFTVTFVLVWELPGSPLEAPDHKRPDPAVLKAMERQYNLDSRWSFITGYVQGLARFDLGPSLQHRGQRVNDFLARGLPVSMTLGFVALVFALLLGSVAGILGALKPGSALDAGSMAVALLGVSLPNFVTGSLLLVLLAGVLNWFPVHGRIEWPNLAFWTEQWGAYASGGWLAYDLRNLVWHLILPAITLSLIPAAYIARLIRLGLADIMSSDYIRTARAKGLSERKALFKHALKVAYLPVLSFLGPAAAAVMTGSFVVEKVFNLPGLGEHFVNAVLNKDQFMILGIVLVYSTMLAVFNLIVDVAYAWFDPRIEL